MTSSRDLSLDLKVEINPQEKPEFTSFERIGSDVKVAFLLERKTNIDKQKNINEILIQAAKEGDIVLVKDCLEKKADINYKELGLTAFHHAIQNEHFHLVHDLIFDGFDFSAAAFKKLFQDLDAPDHEDDEELFYLLNELIDSNKIKSDINLLTLMEEECFSLSLFIRLFLKQNSFSIEILNKLMPFMEIHTHEELLSEIQKQLSEPTYLIKAKSEWTRLLHADGRDLDTYTELKALCERKENRLDDLDLHAAKDYLKILTHINDLLAHDRGYNKNIIIPYIISFLPMVLANITSEYCESSVNYKWRFFSYATNTEEVDEEVDEEDSEKLSADVDVAAKEMLVLKQAGP